MLPTNLTRKLKKHQVILTTLFVLSSLIFILNTNLSPDLYFLNFGIEDISCHYKYKPDDILESLDEHFAPASDSIFFHETSCHGTLTSRQACSIESAAKSNPNREIYVLFSSPINKTTFKDNSMNLLKKYSNVKLRRVKIVDYAKGTPAEKLVVNGYLNRTRWPVSHSSDVLRFLTLYKWGGVYLDLDVVVAKPLDELPKNWVAMESGDTIASSLIAFYRDDVGRMFAEAVLSNQARNFRGDSWAHNGPGAVTRVMVQQCGTSVLSDMSSVNCKGMEVFSPELFFPIRWQEANKFFEPGEISQEPYMYHVWNRITQNTDLVTDSIYTKLAISYCPSVYEAFRSDFG